MPFLGDKKGAILQSLVADKKPNLAVEVGTMAGMCVRVCVRMWVFVHVCLYIFHGRCVLYVCERMRVFVHVCLYIFPSVPFEHSLIQSYEVLDSFAQAVTSLPTFIFISYRIIFWDQQKCPFMAVDNGYNGGRPSSRLFGWSAADWSQPATNNSISSERKRKSIVLLRKELMNRLVVDLLQQKGLGCWKVHKKRWKQKGTWLSVTRLKTFELIAALDDTKEQSCLQAVYTSSTRRSEDSWNSSDCWH